MKKNKINNGVIIFCLILVILFIPIIRDYIKNQNILVLSSDEIKEKIAASESFVLYVGDLDNDSSKELRKIRDMAQDNKGYQYSVYNVKSDDSLKEYVDDNIVVIFIEGEVQKTYAKYEDKILIKDIKRYYLADITEENKSYKIADNYSAYKKIVKSKKVVMSVFGRDNCSHCHDFLLVYNAVAEKYGVDIYYFDSNHYKSSELEKIENMDLTIPAKCSSNAKPYKLSDGYGTPLTIFTKEGKVIDCISGYVKRSVLIEKLKQNNMISE